MGMPLVIYIIYWAGHGLTLHTVVTRPKNDCRGFFGGAVSSTESVLTYSCTRNSCKLQVRPQQVARRRFLTAPPTNEQVPDSFSISCMVKIQRIVDMLKFIDKLL